MFLKNLISFDLKIKKKKKIFFIFKSKRTDPVYMWQETLVGLIHLCVIHVRAVVLFYFFFFLLFWQFVTLLMTDFDKLLKRSPRELLSS